ncbi:hypothetical protein DFQ03_1176 [Maribacter caenipelagi]|uniref:Uncharacterized protein n=1 Tax=Maribacter caenipelagi TaxID=1447781 RepID=A0A4R7DA00_9FLAO|nr:hypothetical protein [Maribacter caenipelagi]TDS16694.1 hypothetical protein DFQ03_1176 [Maribacter caenipelagi]
MKSLLIVLFVAVSSLTTFGQETSTMNGTYEGYIDGVYVFSDGEGYTTEFSNITDDVANEFDLNSEKFVGKQFMITFTVDSEMDEDDEEIQVSTIVKLLMPM